jgi:hypothetical protein
MSGSFAGKSAFNYTSRPLDWLQYLTITAAAIGSPRRFFVSVCTYVAAPRQWFSCQQDNVALCTISATRISHFLLSICIHAACSGNHCTPRTHGVLWINSNNMVDIAYVVLTLSEHANHEQSIACASYRLLA